jgi:hypothetical protein
VSWKIERNGQNDDQLTLFAPVESLTKDSILCSRVGKTKGKGTFGKVKQGTHEPTGEKVSIVLCNGKLVWSGGR